MSEPEYIAQTTEDEHVAGPANARAWFMQQRQIAFARGCTFPRMTVSEDQTALLFEAWEVRPEDQGQPRW